MKTTLGIALLVLVGVTGWRIGGRLDAQALGLAVGMLFGIMAGIPTALILLASQRRTEAHTDDYEQPRYTRIEQQPPAQITHNHVHYHAAPERSRRSEIEERHRLT